MSSQRLASVLIANRGEIACRIARTARRRGMRIVAVYSEADRDALHVAMADEAHLIGPAPAAESYLQRDRIVETARRAGVACLHPGYGFLSEQPELAEACARAGIVFVGPPASAIRAMGLKDRAKDLVAAAGVPVIPGYQGERQEDAFLRAQADAVGYPVLIKAVAGGGGKGIRRVDVPDAFADALESARREAESAFGNARVLIERCVPSPRHIEVQVFCDASGGAIHLFERDCSLQRRHQKIVEEAPAPGMTPETRAAMGRAAVEAARAVGYVGAGTVEFIATGDLRPDGFWFMEMNTRLQVEHPVTEAITGLDLVDWQFRVAAGEPLPHAQGAVRIRGHAIEARLYAEDPQADFRPSTGRLHALRLAEPEGVRVDTGVREGDGVTPFYDPLIAKLIAHGRTRAEAAARLRVALDGTLVAGPRTNLGFLRRLITSEAFERSRTDTGYVDRDHAALVESAPGIDAGCLRRGVLALLASGQPPAAGTSPWDVADGFQLGAARVQVWPLAIDGRRDAVTLVWPEPGAGGEPEILYRGEPASGSGGDRIAIVPAEGGVLVLRDGRQWRLDALDEAEAAPEREAGGGGIAAPMHGRIVAVHVAPGDRVGRGQRLGLIESMKMEHALTAPAAGTIVSVAARAGLQVAEGALLFTLAPEASE
ncbi:acetyl/propionyl/methylcrotonyl-CoA carboxylase subunit alpha [Methylobacterium durans]|uniref:acetyl/propionyl/methylcrotonyl-CoA carboxylase subunit alpha n=1 Tax=Methylobacterium durans TaxID=2202825 RepID=UPI001F310200|nr:biotin carboxylase N-terminal domain-containing protein [Methylobacterium durans]